MEGLLKKNNKLTFNFAKNDWPVKYLEYITCPICRSENYTKLYPKSYRRIVKCKNCSLIYTNPRLKKNHLKSLYSKEYFCNSESMHFGYENYLGDEHKIVKTFTMRLKDVEKYAERGKLLDVGCATGFFMKAAFDRGWEVEGTEISEFAASYVRDHFGFKIYAYDFLEMEEVKNKYSLITMWDVIEHFYDPIKAVKKCSNMLKKEGLLVISTPNVDSFPAKLTKEKWVGYKLSDEHLTYFSPKTISQLLKKGGFEIVKKSHIGKHVSIPMLADRASIYNKYLGLIIKKSQIVLPRNYFLYVNPFDIMCVYAKKI